MRAVIYDGYGATPRVETVADPVCAPHGIVVRIEATGVCRSDWHAWLGHDPVPLPMVPGHEYAGVVAEVGRDVIKWRVGDRVTVPFALGCGRCVYCAQGDTHICPSQTQPGFTQWGSYAEYVAVDQADANVVATPRTLSSLEAAALGCRFATSYRAVRAQGRLQPGQWIAVHGCGGVGLSAIAIAKGLGAQVVAVDVARPALEAARMAGADVAVSVTDLSPEGAVAAVRDASNGGVHVALDAIGMGPAVDSAIAGLRRGGRHVQVGLMLGEAQVWPAPFGRMIAEELELIGSHGMPARDYPEMLDWIAAGHIDLRALIGRVIPLEDAPAALMAMSEPVTQAGMTVVDLCA